MTRIPSIGLALLATLTLPAQAGAEADAAQALQACVAAWNRHEPAAFSECLAADVWFTESEDFYQRLKGRDKVLGWFDYNIRNADLQWDLVRSKGMPDGSVSMRLKQRMSMLPKKDGRYASVFDSDPALARWRLDGGRWRLFFFTSHKGWALAEMKKDGLE